MQTRRHAVASLQRPYATVELAAGTWFVQRDWRSCNHFVARAPQVMLIDTGYGPDLEHTESVLGELGVRPEDIDVIVNTHCHCDHAGGNAFFIARSDAQVWMHAREKTRIDQRDAVGTWWRFHDTWADFFRVDRGLEDGDEIAFGPLVLQVLHAPGHSAGQIVLYCKKLKALFSSDALWQGDMGVINPLVEGEKALEQAVDTLRRIDRLGIEVAYPGHGPVIANPKPVIDRLLRKLNHFGKHPAAMHYDHICKMISYVVLSKGGMMEDGMFDYLMKTMWFPKLVDAFFHSCYRDVYTEAMQQLSRKGMLVRSSGRIFGVERD